MIALTAVFIGGGLGSLLRWLCCTIVSSHWGTFLVNVAGAFFIGLAYSYFNKHAGLSADAKLFIMTGLLGGFTTFSTYLLNFTTLINAHHPLEAFAYLIGSVLIGSLFLLAGIKLAA